MMAATLAEGTTVIENTREPKWWTWLCLNAMGAFPDTALTVTVHGVERLHGCAYAVMPDRIGPHLMVAAAATGGRCG